jgi:hypothetical protein
LPYYFQHYAWHWWWQRQWWQQPHGASYSDEEVNDMLLLLHEIAPIGPHEWIQLEEEHKEKYPHLNRNADSLHQKFNSLANQRIPTGDPACPPLVRFAKQVQQEIKRKANVGTLDEMEEDDGFGEDGEEIGDDASHNFVVHEDPPRDSNDDDEESTNGNGNNGNNDTGNNDMAIMMLAM